VKDVCVLETTRRLLPVSPPITSLGQILFRVLGTCAQEISNDTGAVKGGARSAAAQVYLNHAHDTRLQANWELWSGSCNGKGRKDERDDDVQGLHCEFEDGGFSVPKE